MSLFSAILWACLAVCLCGAAWRMARWLAPDRSLAVPGLPPSAALRYLWRSLSWRDALAAAPRLARAFFIDILLQGHLLRKGSLWRWLMHFTLFVGFSGLLFFHALESFVSRPLFAGYEPTLDPWQFLRNAFGAMVACGLCIALCRRIFLRDMRRTSRFEDFFTLGVISCLIASGFGLEAAKIVSPAAFDRMTADYLPAAFGLRVRPPVQTFRPGRGRARGRPVVAARPFLPVRPGLAAVRQALPHPVHARRHPATRP